MINTSYGTILLDYTIFITNEKDLGWDFILLLINT